MYVHLQKVTSCIKCSIHMCIPSFRRAIRNAFSKWEAVIPLTFREVSSGNADILINWVYRSHGDGSPFDGLGKLFLLCNM
jgi:hypothetical protein